MRNHHRDLALNNYIEDIRCVVKLEHKILCFRKVILHVLTARQMHFLAQVFKEVDVTCACNQFCYMTEITLFRWDF
jgi:hypothetical protein